MARGASQKIKLMYLAEIFRTKTDEMHPLSMKDIIILLTDKGISAERKALYDDIELLKTEFDMDICDRREGSVTVYYLGSDKFELAELQLLADAVACSKFITEKKSNELIRKIGSLTSEYQARSLRRNVIVANRAKTVNEKIYYNIQAIYDAIEHNKQISFLYFTYDIFGNKIFKSDGRRYVMSPYTLAWEDENYYCIGYYEKYGNISNFRVDRMSDIKLSEDDIIKDKSFKIADYQKKVFGMFRGENVKAKIRFDDSLVTVIMDKFGSDCTMKRYDKTSFYITRDINESPTFYAWLSTFGDKAEILSPQSLKDGMKAHLTAALSKL